MNSKFLRICSSVLAISPFVHNPTTDLTFTVNTPPEVPFVDSYSHELITHMLLRTALNAS